MTEYKVKINSIELITHDVLRFITEKPKGYEFEPGQATEVAINRKDWKSENRPFSFTSLPEDHYLEFTTKTYTSHEGVTDELLNVKSGEDLIIHDVFGAINYKGDGVFIAGGAGVTPFISILRELDKKGKVGQNKLIFANKTQGDIIHKEEFEKLLGDNFINILSKEKSDDYEHGHITKDFLEKHIDNFNQYFYICGPIPMIDSVKEDLLKLGVKEEHIVTEDFS